PVKDWIMAHSTGLANDITMSPHVWTVDPQVTCAFTEHDLAKPVVLSFETCRQNVVTTIDAATLLIHESTHHLGVSDETMSDQIAMSLVRGWERRVPGDKHFRYNPRTRQCENELGEIGRNPQHQGECGDWMTFDLSNQNLAHKEFRGANFSFADMLNTDLSGSNLRGADLSFVKMRNVKLDHSLFEDADLQHASIETVNNEVNGVIYFSGANLAYSQLRFQSRYTMDFTNADLTGSKIVGGDIANFDGANLTNASIISAESSFTVRGPNANLTNAAFHGYMRITDLHNAILTNANLSNTAVNGGDFRFKLDPSPSAQPILTGVHFNDQTLLPFSEAEAIARGMIKQ
ncbi:MAG: pentapeptide repeat-containing protein, partial [Pseudomonadota bacterium]